MPSRLLPRGAQFFVLAVAFALIGCATPASAPIWTYAPAPSDVSAASPAASEAASSEAPTPAATLGASEVPATPAPSASASPDTTPPPPGPPDPGEPGFVAGTKASPRVIKIEATDLLLFTPNAVSVEQGETIDFEITNTGKADHEFKIGPMNDVFNDASTVPEVAGITAGSTKSLVYTFTDTGPYAFACHEPGHYENGMIGFVNVVPKAAWIGTVAHPRMIVIRMDDHLEFVPTEVSVTPGETILFVLPNVGTSLTHEFQLGPADRVAQDQVDGQIVVEADQIEPLHVAYLTYTFGGVGPYAFACHEPGHYEAGMKGIIDLTS
jgi:uncharacterized cupredoxin-like copper-binding protein